MRPFGEITERLLAIRGGDKDALNQLVPLVYERLRAMAHARLAGQGPGVSNSICEVCVLERGIVTDLERLKLLYALNVACLKQLGQIGVAGQSFGGARQ